MKKRGLIVIMTIFMILSAVRIIRTKDFIITDRAKIINVPFTDIPEDWRLILVNSRNAVPEGYEPELIQLTNGIYVDSRIYPDLQDMFDDARANGINPVVSEGYRTYEEQENMMTEKVISFIADGYSRHESKALAEKQVAKAGTSEHELGIALDINADTSLNSDAEVYEWLADNTYRYGFIQRYPDGKEYITGIDYEPWHYRYVGKESALEIYREQITLEEYLDKQ